LNETSTCSQCNRNFNNEKALEQHFQAKHNREQKIKPVEKQSPISAVTSSSGKTFIGLIVGAFIIFGLFIFLFSGSSGEIQSPPTGQAALQAINEENQVQATNARIGNAVGNKAPDFVVSTTEGETIRLSDLQKEGKPVVIEFIATWCPYCNKDLTTLKDVYPAYSDKIEFLAIGLDQKESNSVLRNWKQQNNFSVTLASGTSSILRDYGVTYTTTRYIIGVDGLILSKSTGEQSASTWKNLFDSLI